MTYSTTITKEGQITIPKSLREFLKLRGSSRIILEPERNKKFIKIKPYLDILNIAGTFKSKKKMDVLKAREEMEKNYERV
jgi:AbrB family looped-hinge helix DNA binding protein